jgi:gluconokinase
MIIVVMGVSGSGKSKVGRILARKLKIKFVDADSFHSEENIAKMRNGTPLTDEDRLPWLAALHDAIEGWIASGTNVVLACSALKQSYRNILTVDPGQVRFAYLKGSYELFLSRLASRRHHFMKKSMLASQFASLEEPTAEEATICDAKNNPVEIAGMIASVCRSASRS